jgi:hypothetical protein
MPQVLDIGAQDSELQDRRREEQTPRGNHGRENRELTDVTPLIGNGYYYNFRKPKGEERVTYCESCYTGQNVLNAYLYLPYTFQTAGCVRLNVVQTSGKNVQYEVRDYGTVVGYTSVPAAIDCRILANLGACCTQGDFVFGPGSHSVDVYGLSDVQDTGAIKLDPVPCPTSPAPPTAPLTRRPSPAPAPAPVTPMPTRVGTGTGEYSSASSLQRGVWYTFATDDNTYPSWAYGCGPDTDPRRAKCVSTPGVTASANDIPAPWTYATGPTTCSRVVVTDMWFNDNLYELYDAGVSVGRTRASIGDGSPSGGPSCGDNPLVCVASPISSSGAFQLGPGQHSLEIRGFFQRRDRGAFMIQTVPCPTKSPTKNPTKSPTKRPTKSPTKRPTKCPTSRPTRAPTSAPTRRPTAAPTAVPTRAPTAPLTRSPTKTPVATRSCPASGSATRFSIWNGNTNRVAVARMVSGRSYCLSGNWNIRATTLHEKARCGPVEVSLWRAPAGRRATAVRKFKDPAPRFFLFGDNAATGDVYGNAQIPAPLVLTKGQRYCVRSKEPLATGISEVCFTQSC